MLISKGGRIYIIKKTTENFKQHIERSWFIVNTGASVSESRVWQGINEYQCRYNLDVSNKIEELSKLYKH